MTLTQPNKTSNTLTTSKKTSSLWDINLGKSLTLLITSIFSIITQLLWSNRETPLCVLSRLRKWGRKEDKDFHLSTEIDLLIKTWDYSKRWRWVFTNKELIPWEQKSIISTLIQLYETLSFIVSSTTLIPTWGTNGASIPYTTTLILSATALKASVILFALYNSKSGVNYITGFSISSTFTDRMSGNTLDWTLPIPSYLKGNFMNLYLRIKLQDGTILEYWLSMACEEGVIQLRLSTTSAIPLEYREEAIRITSISVCWKTKWGNTWIFMLLELWPYSNQSNLLSKDMSNNRSQFSFTLKVRIKDIARSSGLTEFGFKEAI